MRCAAETNRGLVRKQNQDRFLADPDRGLFVICDGMGGHKAGEVAAQIAVDTVSELFFPGRGTGQQVSDMLADAIHAANRSIHEQAKSCEEYSDMGTTVIAACLDQDTIYAASVGDSAMFLIHQEMIEKVTQDHTLTEQLFQEGLLEETERSHHRFRHILTRAVGTEPTVDVDVHSRAVVSGDYILLGSDGLTDLVEQSEIQEIVASEKDVENIMESLMTLALSRGGPDNITLIIIQI